MNYKNTQTNVTYVSNHCTNSHSIKIQLHRVFSTVINRAYSYRIYLSTFTKMRLISCAVILLALHCSAADVANNNRRLQQRVYTQRLTEQDETSSYPAVGFRPARPFNLPNGEQQQQQAQQPQSNINFNENQPNNFYAAPDAQQPARLQQQPRGRQGQSQPQQFAQQQEQPSFVYAQNPAPQFFLHQTQQFQFGAQQFPNTPQPDTSARLTAEPEERDAEEIEVNVENAAEEIPATRSAAAPLPPMPPQATVTYFPANAVNFVKPFQAGVANPNPAPTFIQYQPNVVASPPLAKVIAANPASLPISSQYYASSAFLPSTVAFNSFTSFPRAAAPLQAW